MSYYILIMWLETFLLFCMWMLCLGWGYTSLTLCHFLSRICKCLAFAFKEMVERFYNSRYSNSPCFPSLRCVCVPPLTCTSGVGLLYVPPCHLVAPASFANATVWVTLRQFAPHRLISVSSKHYFFHWQGFCIWAHSILLLFSSLRLFFCSVPILWLYLTALNCCSPAFFIWFFKVWGGVVGVMSASHDAVK